MAHAGLPAAWAHLPAVLPGAVLAGTGLVAAATVAGAWLARRRPGQRQIWFAAAAGALLIIAGLHLLPDAWAGARAAGIWPGLVPLAAVAAFAAAGLAARAGCGCCSPAPPRPPRWRPSSPCWPCTGWAELGSR